MIDFSAPSFSLGLDFDIADLPTDDEREEKGEEEREPPASHSPTFDLFGGQELREDDEEDGEIDPGQADPETPQDPPPPALKRLRRGPGVATPGNGGASKDASAFLSHAEDDDIEEFSSQEERPSRDRCSSAQSRITCSTSKFSLRTHGILTSQSTTKSRITKASPASTLSTSTVLQDGIDKKMFPNFTSPLRKIHLLDSDSDDSLNNDGLNSGNKVDRAKRRLPDSFMKEQTKGNDLRKHKEESLRRNFTPTENLATPTLDEFCEDYFRSVKDPRIQLPKEVGTSFYSSGPLNTDYFEGYCRDKSATGTPSQNWNLTSSQPPAFQYFYHDDARIRMLVKERLCHFVPLGVEYSGGNHGMTQSIAEDLNNMNQHYPSSARSQARKSRKRVIDKSLNSRKNLDDNGNWINPKEAVVIPKDAGKRRIQAGGRQSGHWFTGQDGRKVYVAKNGQELVGQLAYRQYRKESGSGFRRSKKKKSVAKKKKKG